jgi:hypothetical protein
LTVSEIILETLQNLKMSYPMPSEARRAARSGVITGSGRKLQEVDGNQGLQQTANL